MLRTLGGLGALPLFRAPALLLLPARGRKTRHDPPAKSKVGLVKTPPAVDPAEFFVLTERYRQYRQTVRALRLEFVSEVRKKVHEARTGVLAERRAQEDAAEHRELMAWNQAENRRLHELRLARLRLEAQEQEQRQAEERARRAREEQARMQLKEQEVLRLQEEAKNFITRENLEARVEEALDNPKDYNWAITKEGLVIKPQHRGS
ncbi:28S ribosomal protein S26, mitochondrial [Sciurus carolinensis]|uniref:Small ribosomal subunit protein mS26 n=1 Tax=Sciurus carolinensis TaxID=30640 RepID=A0AA41MHR2_SCICA|nr:28S ribosomal protein S26, mitochondrial [Sciurus carolinensis]MBZ3871932.1 28S ribosomal protein S26, mitochondrial [Sciurus carolinensis]